MSSDQVQRPPARRKTALLGIGITLRSTATIVLLIWVYFVLPVGTRSSTNQVLWLVAALAAFTAIVSVQLRWITKSRYPRLRAVESLAAFIPLFLVVFARAYLSMEHHAPGSFSTHLDKVKSLYFTVTVFSTVGFGDITPTRNSARVLTSVQMLLDLVVLGAAVKLLFGAAERTVAQRKN